MSRMNSLYCLILFLIYARAEAYNSKCWDCTCNLRSLCKPKLCLWNEKACGKFKFDIDYWDWCGKPGKSFTACANHYPCVYECLKVYMNNPASFSGCSAECKPYLKDYSSEIPADDPYLKYIQSLGH